MLSRMRTLPMLSSTLKGLAVAAVAVFVCVGIALLVAFAQYRSARLFTIVHLPDTYPRRSLSLSANVTAHVPLARTSIRFRVNDHAWHRIANMYSPRYVNGVVTLEMPSHELRSGANTLQIEASAPLRSGERYELSFSYDPSPVELPIRRSWKDEQLEAQDGYWEVVEVEGDWRVRPKPGYEGYDRLLLVTGAFPVPRRIETYAIHREARESVRHEVGFGVLSLWGGHPGGWSQLPRKGWSFAMGLYWSKPGGVGSEISHFDETGTPRWVNSYRDAPLIRNVKYRIIIELDERRAGGRHRSYRQRMKMWPEGQREPDEWILLTDKEGALLPEGEYAVALFALDNQVEFGPIDVLPLHSASEEADGWLSRAD